jgi:hypothetical protein
MFAFVSVEILCNSLSIVCVGGLSSEQSRADPSSIDALDADIGACDGMENVLLKF